MARPIVKRLYTTMGNQEFSVHQLIASCQSLARSESRMSQRKLSVEAEDCRSRANEFEGRPEKAFLLRLATEFDRLENEQTYFARRASQEVTAAVHARHPNARRAHLTLARTYDARSHGRIEAQGLNS